MSARLAVLFVLLGWSHSISAAPPDSKTDENSLENLAAIYKRYELPFPPKTARLVRFRISGTPPKGELGFLVERKAPSQPSYLLFGTTRFNPQNFVPFTPVEVEKLTEKEITALVEATDSPASTKLALAIQCRARGLPGLARALHAKALKESGKQSANQSLFSTAWAHWEILISESFTVAVPGQDTSLKTIARHLKALREEDRSLRTMGEEALYRSLELAIKPSKAKPGSVEALIDDLVEVRLPLHLSIDFRWPADPRLLRILERGFDAIPALIEHLEDDRLTRNYNQQAFNFGGFHDRVACFAGDLVTSIAGDDLGTVFSFSRLVEKKDALAWWEKAKKIGEERYLVERALPTKTEIAWPQVGVLRILAKKYPQRLPEIYRKLLDKWPELSSDTVARAISASTLSGPKKKEIFLKVARHENLRHRWVALEQLKKFDANAFRTEFLESLRKLPTIPPGPYRYCPEAGFVRAAVESEDAEVWKAVLAFTKRAEVGLRLEILHRIWLPDDIDDQARTVLPPSVGIPQRISLLAALLDDTTIRDVATDPDKYRILSGHTAFPKIEVRNYAARILADLLEIAPDPPYPDAKWKAEDWARLREQVRKALRNR